MFHCLALRLRRRRRKPLYDVISRRRLANISQTMKVVRCLENHRARAHTFGDAVLHRFDSSLFDDDQLFLRMPVWIVRSLARINRGYVTLKHVQRRRWRFEEIAPGSGFCRPGFDCIPVKDRRSQHWFSRLSQSNADKRQARGQNPNQQVSSRNHCSSSFPTWPTV